MGPCGHSARDKGILIKVITSCLSHQVPRQLAFSVNACLNDMNTGVLFFIMSPNADLPDAQYTKGINFTLVRCGQDSIQDECLCLPQANWRTWSKRKRMYKVKGIDKGRKAWHILLTIDDDETTLLFIEKIRVGRHDKDLNNYGVVLKSGWGEEPTNEEYESTMKKYESYRSKQD